MSDNLTGLLTTGAEALSTFTLSQTTEEVIFRVFVILILGALSIPSLLRLLAKVLAKSKALASLQNYILSSARVGLWFLLILMVADALGIPVSSIFALLGVAGLALSLALQNTLSNLAGGLQVLLSRPFEVGDYIDTDQGSGKVAEIGLAYSKLSTVDNKEVLIPNHLMASSKIVNHTASGLRRVDLIFPASYEASTKEVRQAILAVTETIAEIHQDPAPEVFLTEFGDSALSYTLRAWTTTDDYWPVRFRLMEEVRDSFDKHNIAIPYQQINVHFQEKRGQAYPDHGESH